MNQKKTANFGRSKPAWRSWRTVLFKRKQEELPSLCLFGLVWPIFPQKICFCILYRMLDIQKGPAPFGAGPFCYVLGSMICIVGKISLSWGNIDFSRKGKVVCSVGLRLRLPPALVILNKMSLKSGIYARLRIVRRTKTRPCTIRCKVLFFYVGVNTDCLSEKNLYYPTTWYPWPCRLIIADDCLNCKIIPTFISVLQKVWRCVFVLLI